MSAFIKLNKQDAYITSYTAHKAWNISNSELNSYGIYIYTALSSSGDIYIENANLTTHQEYSELVYKNIHHLYYSRFREGAVISSSYDTYDQTTLYSSASRQLYTTASLVSIPKDLYGHSIKPGTFGMAAGALGNRYLSSSFVSGGFIVEITDTDGFIIYDDGEGVLRDADKGGMKVGDIIYTHGHAIITDETTAYEVTIQDNYTLTFQGSHNIYTHNYRCKTNESQLNYSQNPSIKSGSNGDMYDYATGSYFQPYVTTVGLYNDSNELIGIGKLAQPTPKSRYTDTTFVVKFDI